MGAVIPSKTKASKNGGASVGARPQINIIEGTNITATVADNAGTNSIDITLAASNGPAATTAVGITVNGFGVALLPGFKGYTVVPFTGTIVGWDLVADQSGSCVFDVWKRAGAIPTVAHTITASAKPTLSSQQLVESTTLTGWTTSVTAGDVIGFNLDSSSTITSATLNIRISR